MSEVTGWLDSGAVKSLGTIKETRGAKSSNHYGIFDLLLAKTVFPELSIDDFARNKVRLCLCDNIVLRDWDLNPTQVCEHCQEEITLQD